MCHCSVVWVRANECWCFGVNKSALNEAGASERTDASTAFAAPWVELYSGFCHAFCVPLGTAADSSVLPFLTCKTGHCSLLASQRCCAGNGLYNKAISGMKKPAKKGKKRQMFSSGLVMLCKGDRGLHNEYYREEQKEVLSFYEHFCLVPSPDRTRLMAGDDVKCVLHGRDTKCELRPHCCHYLTLHVPFCSFSISCG